MRVAVIVKVPDSNPHAVNSAVRYTRGVGYIGKCAVGVLAIQSVLARFAIQRKTMTSTLHKENVQPAIVVKVKECAAASHRFNEILLRCGSIDVLPSDAERPRDFSEYHVRRSNALHAARSF